MVHLEGEATGAEVEATEAAPDTQGAETVDTSDNTDEQNLYPDDGPEAGEPIDDEDDAGDDADEPSVEAPVSLKADEKEKFLQLPREAQQALSEIIQRREQDAQKGVIAAQSAQREAERTAADKVAQTQRDFAHRFANLAAAFAPQPPPLEMARDNPAEYQYQKALYDQEIGEFQGLVQQIAAINGEAEQHDAGRTREWADEQIKQLMTIPEIADESTRAQFVEGVRNVGTELGYSAEALAQADANDIMALRKAMGWKSDAEKWRAYQKRRNERPREAKGRFTTAPAGARAAGPVTQTDTLKALYPND